MNKFAFGRVQLHRNGPGGVFPLLLLIRPSYACAMPSSGPFPEESDAHATDSPAHSLDLPSLQPLTHDHPLLSAEGFDVDTFLLSRIHIPLEELRGELRTYLRQLREELVQLINDDYEEFISLGTGLRGEGERLRRLEKPLNRLSEEVEGVRGVLMEHQEAVRGKLNERAALREERALLDLLLRLFETLARAEALLAQPDEDDRAKLVSRVAGEYTQLVYLVNKARAERCVIVDTVTEVSKNLLSELIIAHRLDQNCAKQGSLDHPGGRHPALVIISPTLPSDIRIDSRLGGSGGDGPNVSA